MKIVRGGFVRTITLLSLLVLMATAAGAEEKLFVLRGGRLLVIEPLTGGILASRSAGKADFLLGTPGGKYVFVLNRQNGLGEAVDFENPSESKTLDLSRQAPLRNMRFSPDGSRLYVLGASDPRVLAFPHLGGELGEPSEISIPGNGLPALNSRGTRYYRQNGTRLGYYLTRTEEEIQELDIGEHAEEWTSAPGGRHIWGLDSGGWVVVDEARGRVNRLPGNQAEIPQFHPDGRRGWAMSDGGSKLLEIDLRRLRITDTEEAPVHLSDLAVTEQAIWLTDGSSLLFRAFPDTDFHRVEAGSGPVRALEAVILKPGGGFACFR